MAPHLSTSTVLARPSAPPTAATGPAWSRRVARTLKRGTDVVVGTVLLLAALPVVAALAVVLAVQLRGWPFFVHHRVGPGLRPIWFPKLRTLPRHTPTYADKSPEVIRPVSRLAAVLRRTHLDELPQLVLVPLGRLSLVGPRPMMAHELEGVDHRWRHQRLRVRQGCTGLWQISVGQGLRVRDSPEFDLAYVRHGSLRMDAWILWRTVRQCFGGRGIELHDVPRWALAGGFVAPDAEAAALVLTGLGARPGRGAGADASPPAPEADVAPPRLAPAVTSVAAVGDAVAS